MQRTNGLQVQRDPETGNRPTELELWRITHERPNGRWADERSKNAYVRDFNPSKLICKSNLIILSKVFFFSYSCLIIRVLIFFSCNNAGRDG